MRPGAFPTMIVPYKADGSIDYDAQARLVEWYIEQGAAGLFTVCLSTEMYELSPEERISLATFVVKTAAGRVPVISCGTFGSDVAEMAAFSRRMHKETGVDAVVVLASQMCGADDSETIWKDRVTQFMHLVGPDIPLGTYECPKPYHRCLSPETLGWVASTGQFIFHKDTCCDSTIISRKLAAVRPFPSFRFYNANVATLAGSVREGAHGFSGICANFYPSLVARLCANPSDESLRLFLTVGEAVVAHKYPQSAKLFIGKHVFPGLVRDVCRGDGRTHPWPEEELLRLHALYDMSEAMRISGFP